MMERELSLKRLFEPLELPCGATIKNRFLKSSMSEALGTKKNAPTSELSHLYETWANGGTGVSITGTEITLENPNSEPIISNSSTPKETSILNFLLSGVIERRFTIECLLFLLLSEKA